MSRWLYSIYTIIYPLSDKDDNLVRILINADETYAVLTYMASDADEGLDEIQAILDKTKGDAEDLERENNKDNNTGL